MVVLELRDVVAGVLARTSRREDCTRFLGDCIARKYGEIAALDGIDPFTTAVIHAEIQRLRTLRGLLDGTIVYDTSESENADEAAVGQSTPGEDHGQ
jgi:hypothetical protein